MSFFLDILTIRNDIITLLRNNITILNNNLMTPFSDGLFQIVSKNVIFINHQNQKF